MDCYFVVDEVGDTIDVPDFDYWARGKQGRKLRPRVPISEYLWFQELRARLADFAAGLSDIGPKTIAELERLVAERNAG